MTLTRKQSDHLRTAYTLYQANGFVRARTSAFRSGCRTLVRLGLLVRRTAGKSVVFDLTPQGLALARAELRPNPHQDVE